jgi:hypothetical protein
MQSSGDNGYGDDSDSMSSALDDVVTPVGTKFGKGKSKHKKKSRAPDGGSGRDLAPLKNPSSSYYSYGAAGLYSTCVLLLIKIYVDASLHISDVM